MCAALDQPGLHCKNFPASAQSRACKKALYAFVSFLSFILGWSCGNKCAHSFFTPISTASVPLLDVHA